MSDASGLHLSEASGRWVLAAAVMGSAVAMLDATVINVALPRLGRDLGADFAGLQWVVNGYTLVLASLILLGGSLGDRLGRKQSSSSACRGSRSPRSCVASRLRSDSSLAHVLQELVARSSLRAAWRSCNRRS